MSTDVVEDLVQVYKGSTPPDITATEFGEDLAYVIAEIMAMAEAEVSRLAIGARLGTATGLFLIKHAEDRGLRKQDGETDPQQRVRYQKPPKAVTKGNILDAVKSIVGGTQATLDLGLLTTNCQTVIRARLGGDDGNRFRLRFVADGTGDGVLEEVGYELTFHFESGVTTVADFETSVNSSPNVEVMTVDGVGTLVAPDDTFTYESMSGGLDAPCFIIELPHQSLYYDRSMLYDGESYYGGARGVIIVLIPESADAYESVFDAVRSKIAAGKLFMILEYT